MKNPGHQMPIAQPNNRPIDRGRLVGFEGRRAGFLAHRISCIDALHGLAGSGENWG